MSINLYFPCTGLDKDVHDDSHWLTTICLRFGSVKAPGEELSHEEDQHGPHPLPNSNVKCYFNSLLQCLAAQLKLPAVQAQLRWQSTPNTCQCPCCAVCEALWRVLTNVLPRHLPQTLSKEDMEDLNNHPHIGPLIQHEYFHRFRSGNGQQDVHELFMHILNQGQRHCEVNHSPLELLQQQFSVKTRNSKTCHTCKAFSWTGDAILQNMIHLQFEHEGDPINLKTYLNRGIYSEAA